MNILTGQATAQDEETRIFLTVMPDQPCPDVYIERRFIEHAIVLEKVISVSARVLLGIAAPQKLTLG